MVHRLGLSLPRKSVDRITEQLDMTIVVDCDVKSTKQNKQQVQNKTNSKYKTKQTASTKQNKQKAKSTVDGNQTIS